MNNTLIVYYSLEKVAHKPPHHTMPFRLLQYMVEIWRDIYKNTPEKERKRKSFKLPIVPAVLYNGKKGWTAHQSFREYQSGHEQFSLMS